MTQLFRDMRLYGNIILLLLTATVLGITAYWASIFLPDVRHDYSIFALIIPSLTILLLLVGLQWSTPRTEAFFLFVLGVLWLAMAAWTTDVIGNMQCDAQTSDDTVPTKNGGTLAARSWCYEMRVVQAFSWMIFCLYAIFLYILIALTTRAKSLGRPFAWAEPIVELPWFGQWPGYPEGQYPQNGMYQMPYAYPAGQPMSMGSMGSMGYPAGGQVAPGYVIQQNPGHSVVIQPGVNGQPPTITQVPGSEEMVLITAFGLMWFAILLGWRAFQQRGIAPGNAAGSALAGEPGQYSEGFTGGKRPYPCRSDSVYCVVEEWTYW
ncbi:hypothetical protein C8Q76DRAFT_793930 [Earliella scabrosa]|nr:hypothetical protein C8Q76DRAFT_793930 [Earliella scabrosa]